MSQSWSIASRVKAVVLMTVLALSPAPALTASADPVASPSIVGEWSVRKCFTSGSPSWTTVVGHCFDGTWTFTTDGGTFVGTWSGQHPDFTAAFDRRDGHTGSETVTALTMTSATTATGDIRSVADCTGCGTAEGTVTLTRTAYHCTDGRLTTEDADRIIAAAEEVDAVDTSHARWREDPCRLRAEFGLGDLTALSASTEGDVDILVTGGGAVWEVHEMRTQESTQYSQGVRCFKLQGHIPVLTTGGTSRSLGRVVVTHNNICTARHPAGHWVVTNGNEILEVNPDYDPGPQEGSGPSTNRSRVLTGWEPPARPTVTTETSEWFMTIRNAGLAGSGVSHFETGNSHGTVHVTIQVEGGINLGVPGTQGLFIGVNKVVDKSYTITASDLGGGR